MVWREGLVPDHLGIRCLPKTIAESVSGGRQVIRHEDCSGARPRGASGTCDQMADVGQSSLRESRGSEKKVHRSEEMTEPNPEAVRTG
jgi:hypothetical protein